MPSVLEMNYADAFAANLLLAGSACPDFVTGPDHKGAERRFDVYRNNVSVGLVNVLASMFPATLRIVGEAFFRAMARNYVRAHPPRSRLLVEYGQDLPDFIARFEPLSEMSWLADVAAIERAWLDSYHAADAEPLAIAALAAIPHARLIETTFAAHPAARLVRSRYAAVTVFSVNRQESEVGAIDIAVPEDGLITRPRLDVSVRILPPGGAAFLQALWSGQTLGDAAGLALAEDTRFDLGANIAGMVEAGALAAIRS